MGSSPKTGCASGRVRTPDEAEIDYGPISWRMTEERLWISNNPDTLVSEWLSSPDINLVPNIATRYLERVPYLPFERAWFNWNVSTAKTGRLERMLENLLPSEWPEGI